MKLISTHKLTAIFVLITFFAIQNPLITEYPQISPVSGINDQGLFQSVNITEVEYIENGFSRLPAVSIGDGEVSDIWNQVRGYPNPSFGSNGEVKSVYGMDTIYFLLTFDSSISWVAVQWDSDFTGEEAIPMEENDDMWVLGQTEYTIINGDGYSAGQSVEPYIYADNQNDVRFESIDKDSITQIEISRALYTGDTEGRDIQFQPGTNYTMMYASDQFHGIENDIAGHTFQLSDIMIENQNSDNQFSPATVDQYVFFIKYINIALSFGCMVLLVVVLPIQLIWRRT